MFELFMSLQTWHQLMVNLGTMIGHQSYPLVKAPMAPMAPMAPSPYHLLNLPRYLIMVNLSLGLALGLLKLEVSPLRMDVVDEASLRIGSVLQARLGLALASRVEALAPMVVIRIYTAML
jgi:hypothetical protein